MLECSQALSFAEMHINAFGLVADNRSTERIFPSGVVLHPDVWSPVHNDSALDSLPLDPTRPRNEEELGLLQWKK